MIWIGQQDQDRTTRPRYNTLIYVFMIHINYNTLLYYYIGIEMDITRPI